MTFKIKMNDGSIIIGNQMPNVELVDFRKSIIHFHAESIKPNIAMILEAKGMLISNDAILTSLCIDRATSMFNEILKQNPCPESVKDILEHDYRKKDQERILKGLSITKGQLLSIFFQAEVLGYKFSNFIYNGMPKNISAEDLPHAVYVEDNGNVISSGGDNLSKGQLRAIVSDIDRLIVRILTKGNHWHCFLQTVKGLKGEETGKEGARPHIHYLSDKFCNLSYEDLKKLVTNGKYPSSPVHIPLV